MSSCLPGRVMSLESNTIGIVTIGGVPQRIRLGLVIAEGTPVGVGDWILVRRGLALAVVDAAELPSYGQPRPRRPRLRYRLPPHRG
jgi:hydrogenase maturation factor